MYAIVNIRAQLLPVRIRLAVDNSLQIVFHPHLKLRFETLSAAARH
jgi:hypothetical protein